MTRDGARLRPRWRRRAGRQRPQGAERSADAEPGPELCAQRPPLAERRHIGAVGEPRDAERTHVGRGPWRGAEAALDRHERHALGDRAAASGQRTLELGEQRVGTERRVAAPGDERDRRQRREHRQGHRQDDADRAPAVRRGDPARRPGRRRGPADRIRDLAGAEKAARRRQSGPARRRRRGRRIERDPAVVREPGLDPGMGVDVGHEPLLGRLVVGARGEPGRDPRRHSAHPQQQRHRTGELLAVASPVHEQERDQRIGGERRVLVVAELVGRREVAHHALHERVWRLGLGGERPSERVRLPVGRAADRGRAREARRVGLIARGGVAAELREQDRLRAHAVRRRVLGHRQREVGLRDLVRIAARRLARAWRRLDAGCTPARCRHFR